MNKLEGASQLTVHAKTLSMPRGMSLGQIEPHSQALHHMCSPANNAKHAPDGDGQRRRAAQEVDQAVPDDTCTIARACTWGLFNPKPQTLKFPRATRCSLLR